jgi:hypothetical protein
MVAAIGPPSRRAIVPTTQPHPTPDELARLAGAIFDRLVRPTLRPDQDGSFVAIDVISDDYEIDADDYAAVMRLRARRPAGEIWLSRVGDSATYRIGRLP